MIRAYRLYTGPDGNSHVGSGSVSGDKLVEAESIHFEETPPHSSLEWHDAHVPQYVITLAGVLEFTTVGGETFTIHPGEVLLAEDNEANQFVARELLTHLGVELDIALHRDIAAIWSAGGEGGDHQRTVG